MSECPPARGRLNGSQSRARVWWYRALMLGCALGLAMFLTGNFVTARGLLLF